MYFSSVKLLHHMVVWLQQRWKWCLKFAGREHSTGRICFYWLSCMLLVWHKLLIWEKAITKKRIAILIKETKIKTLEPGNKSLLRSIIFLSSEKARTQKKKKRWAGFNNNLDFDDCRHAEYQELWVPWLKDLGREKTCQKTYFHSWKCLFYFLLILSHGCSLVEDFNNFRLCGSAANPANTKLPAAKYMAWKFRLLKTIEPAFALCFWSRMRKINK